MNELLDNRDVFGRGEGRLTPADSESRLSAPDSVFTFKDVGEFFRLRGRIICVPIIIAIALAFIYLHFTVPTYTAHAQIIIDPRLPQFIPNRTVDSMLAWDTAQVESEIAVLQSERIAGLVVSKLGLDRDPSFRSPPSLMSGLLGSFLPSGGSQNAADPVREALAAIGSGLDIRRTGLSYAIDISFSFPDPSRAQQVANATAETYIADQLENRAEAARLGGEWLQQRMVSLRAQMNRSSRRAQTFRAGHNYAVPPGQPPDRSPTGTGPDTAQQGGTLSNAETLEELESDAATYKKIYESFLQSYTESVQRQSFPVSDAHILTPAALPLIKSAPRSALVLALAMLIGTLVGTGAAVTIHKLDRTVRRPSQVEQEIGLATLASVPLPKRRAGFGLLAKVGDRLRLLRRGARIRAMAATAPANWAGRRFGVAAHYFNAFARRRNRAFDSALAILQTNLDLSRNEARLGLIGVTSVEQGQGTSTICGNLAARYAANGSRTLLIDAHFHHPMLSRCAGRSDRPGLLQILNGQSNWNEAVVSLESPDINFVAASDWLPVEQEPHLRGETPPIVLRDLAESYDVAIVDLGPILPVGASLPLSRWLDGVVVAVRVNKSMLDDVGEAARHLGRAQARVLGCVLTHG